MCGRFVRQREIDAIVREFGVDFYDCSLKPSYNVAPTQEVAVVIADGGDGKDSKKRLVAARWGLVPPAAASLSGGSRLINARAETLIQKPAFKEAYLSRRCLVVANGFYEWQKEGGAKRPMYIRLKGDISFGFAGLYENWLSPEGKQIRTCTIITCEPNEIMSQIHNRMPVIMPREMENKWLDANIDAAMRLRLLKPYPAEEMKTWEVSSLVNSPANDSPDCIRPAVEFRLPVTQPS
ncbi:MAG TPA: SOS response-associated peptidase, partial [Blastocatellia bacterium]|nr:SOS response-associated peptidase [Blastocatellia bacterium]